MVAGTPQRVACVGLGNHGTAIARALIDRGADIAVAVDPRLAGRSLAEVLGVELDEDVTVAPSIPDGLDGVPVPDFAVLAANNDMAGFHALACECVDRGVPVITIQGVAFYPWRDDAELAADIDARAKRQGVAVIPTGVQDVSWVAPAAAFSAGVANLRDISFVGTVDLAMYPNRITDDRLVDPPDEGVFERAFESGHLAWVFKGALEALADRLGLEIHDVDLSTAPVRCEEPRWCAALDRELAPGTIVGCRELTRVTTSGPDLLGDFGMCLFAAGETSKNDFTIHGESTLTIVQPAFPGYDLTNASVVNRVPDLLAAEPGYHPTSRLPAPRFQGSLRPALSSTG